MAAGAGGLRRRALWVCLLALGLLPLLAGPQTASAENRAPLTHLSQIGPALMACWRPPAGSEGSVVTLRFGLNAKGRLKGVPLASYSHLTGSWDDQKAFMAAALLALERCTPLAMQPNLARVVASRVLTMTFSAPVRGLAI